MTINAILLPVIIVVIIVIVYAVIKSKGRNKPNVATIKMPKNIRLDELDSNIEKLMNGEVPHNFFGITSDGVDCIYLLNNKGKIDLDYEVITEQQKPYVDKLKALAKENNLTFSETTYGNEPEYEEVKAAPVCKIELNSDTEKAKEFVKTVMRTTFNKDESTVFEVVP